MATLIIVFIASGTEKARDGLKKCDFKLDLSILLKKALKKVKKPGKAQESKGNAQSCLEKHLLLPTPLDGAHLLPGPGIGSGEAIHLSNLIKGG